MNVCDIVIADHANGDGMRVTVFVSGCRNHCPGCFNPETWDFKSGKEYTSFMETAIINELKKPGYKGLTILGGEPFEEENQMGLISLIRKVRDHLPDRDIWMYTGYSYEDLLPGGSKHTEVTDEILAATTVLVDGRFLLEEKDISLRFRGSRNQRLIDMKHTREEGQVALWM